MHLIPNLSLPLKLRILYVTISSSRFQQLEHIVRNTSFQFPCLRVQRLQFLIQFHQPVIWDWRLLICDWRLNNGPKTTGCIIGTQNVFLKGYRSRSPLPDRQRPHTAPDSGSVPGLDIQKIMLCFFQEILPFIGRHIFLISALRLFWYGHGQKVFVEQGFDAPISKFGAVLPSNHFHQIS
jgi:hypothetical protein